MFLVDCADCRHRPPNIRQIFGRVLCLEGTPALLGYQEVEPCWCTGKAQKSCRQARPRPGRSLGRLLKPCVPWRTEDLRWGGCGCCRRLDYSALLICRRFVCRRFDSEVRLWVLSPGEPYPGRECLLCRIIFVC